MVASTPRKEGTVEKKISFDLDDLPVDVFDVAGAGLTVESLTDGHGMTEVGASLPFCFCCDPNGGLCSCSVNK